MGETKGKKREAKKKSKKTAIIKLIVALVVVVVGGVLFVGAASGWFSKSEIVLDQEYYGEGANYQELSVGEYEGLINDGKSFLVFVDQSGCQTAEELKGYMSQYMARHGVLAYKMMFSDAKNSSLHDAVKYYPSVAIVSKGKVVAWLRADSDEDAAAYNNYDDFEKWMNKYLK